MNKKNCRTNKHDNPLNSSNIDNVIIQQMSFYDPSTSCMVFGNTFSELLLDQEIFEEKCQKKIIKYQYFLGKLLQLIDNMPMPLIIHDKNFCIVGANNAYLKLVNKNCNEIIGKYYGEIFPNDNGSPPKCICKLPKEVTFKDKYYKIYSFPMEDPEMKCYQLSMHFFEDISQQKETAVELEDAKEQLLNSLLSTIQVISTTLEQRDPYISNHQKRVSELAVAIAKEMKLNENKIIAIKLSSMIHDIGKINVPSDILSKPGNLRTEEMELIRLHSTIAYEILENVKFPWPIKEIIVQHHERLDGSGYPKGLKANEIMLEAKIIAVADVVEAMSQHRPYRAALGLDAALEEIEKHKGIFYDAKVVETCIKLFRTKNFQFT